MKYRAEQEFYTSTDERLIREVKLIREVREIAKDFMKPDKVEQLYDKLYKKLCNRVREVVGITNLIAVGFSTPEKDVVLIYKFPKKDDGGFYKIGRDEEGYYMIVDF